MAFENQTLWIGLLVVIAAIVIGWSVFSYNKGKNDDGGNNPPPAPVSATAPQLTTESGAAHFIAGYESNMTSFNRDFDGDAAPARSFTTHHAPVVGELMPHASEPAAAEGLVASGDLSQIRGTQGFCEGVDRYGPTTVLSVSSVGHPEAPVPYGAARTPADF